MKFTPEKMVEKAERESTMDGEDQVGGKTDGGRTDGGQKREGQLHTITLPAPASKNLPLFIGKKATSSKPRQPKGWC